jgi:hypothetical protein
VIWVQSSGKMATMKRASSRNAAQIQLLTLSETPPRLGSVLHVESEIGAEGGGTGLNSAGVRCSGEIRQTLFPEGPPEAKSLDQVKTGIRQHLRAKHARR